MRGVNLSGVNLQHFYGGPPPHSLSQEVDIVKRYCIANNFFSTLLEEAMAPSPSPNGALAPYKRIVILTITRIPCLAITRTQLFEKMRSLALFLRILVIVCVNLLVRFFSQGSSHRSNGHRILRENIEY